VVYLRLWEKDGECGLFLLGSLGERGENVGYSSLCSPGICPGSTPLVYASLPPFVGVYRPPCVPSPLLPGPVPLGGVYSFTLLTPKLTERGRNVGVSDLIPLRK